MSLQGNDLMSLHSRLTPENSRSTTFRLVRVKRQKKLGMSSVAANFIPKGSKTTWG